MDLAADLPRWALAFAIRPWPERRKAQIWADLDRGLQPLLVPQEARELEALDPSWAREEARRRKAWLLLPGDPEAVRLLEALPYPVPLWVRGSLPPDGPTIALVGSREASPQGLARARAWARRLTEGGVHVLSGLARGIDGAAHIGALEVGRTWGVMGSGLDHPYPREHTRLMDQMVAAGGGVLTPFPPGATPHKWHFPRRNWLLAAWSRGVCVLEARLKSGSLVTARLALDLGREVWACPGLPEAPLAEGPNALLREGAGRCVRSASDLLEDLGLEPLPGLPRAGARPRATPETAP